MAWDIEVGETLLRKDLHDRWGGGRYGGMEPSVKAESVFLFSNPSAGEIFGYKYDGWHADGTLHYTGDGQVGDQSLRSGGNKSLLDAEALGRTVRVFRSEGRDTTYLGAFELADPPYYRADALDREGEIKRCGTRLEPPPQATATSHSSQDQDLAQSMRWTMSKPSIQQHCFRRRRRFWNSRGRSSPQVCPA
jgi:hypothetical protein